MMVDIDVSSMKLSVGRSIKESGRLYGWDAFKSLGQLDTCRQWHLISLKTWFCLSLDVEHDAFRKQNEFNTCQGKKPSPWNS